MKRTAVLLLLLLGICALSLTACNTPAPSTDYNAVVSAQVFADVDDALLKCAYNTDGSFLSIVKADFSLTPSNFGESFCLRYDESGVLSSIYMRKNIFGTDIPVTLTDGALPATVKKDTLEVRLTATGDRIEKLMILKEDVTVAELSFDEVGRLSSIVKYEEGVIAYTAAYTYEEGKTTTTATLSDESSFSAALTFDGAGKPLSYAGAIETDGASYTMTGNWSHGADPLFTLRLSDGAGVDVNNEFRYTFDKDEHRLKETLSNETYENQRMVSKTVFIKDYNASGEYLSYSVDSYKNGLILEKRFTEHFDWTGTTTQSTETSYNENGTWISVFDIYLLADGKTNKTVFSKYNGNDTAESRYEEVFSYNPNGEMTQKTSTEYNAQGKAVNAQILTYDIFGNLLTREEITYTNILGIKVETYKKYDASGNLISQGTRNTQ